MGNILGATNVIYTNVLFKKQGNEWLMSVEKIWMLKVKANNLNLNNTVCCGVFRDFIGGGGDEIYNN